MNLFEPLVDENQLHKNFKEILRSEQEPDRDELQRWVSGFPDRDNKFIKEFQTTFNSSFWEIYLFALFNEMGFDIHWQYPSPDFFINTKGMDIVVEATVASSAIGKTPEWEKNIEDVPTRFKKMNVESIIRLSNSIVSKYRKYKSAYSNLEHVKSNSFVVAVAPFEQPYFNQQYDVPIMALLYDYYVDEDTFNDNPDLYPNGPPGVRLGSVEKENGAEIELGFFVGRTFEDISAIVLSTTATWGKVESMSDNPNVSRYTNTVWLPDGGGNPISRQNHKEKVRDGLLVFHNPYAKHPLHEGVFKADGIVQVFVDLETQTISKQINGDCLMHRSSISLMAMS